MPTRNTKSVFDLCDMYKVMTMQVCIENGERKAIERALEDESREIGEHFFDNAVMMVAT